MTRNGWALVLVALAIGVSGTYALTRTSGGTNDATVTSLTKRVAAEEQATKILRGTVVNQACELRQFGDELELAIARVAALEAGQPKPPAPAPRVLTC